MGTEIDDLYIILRAQYAPLVEGFEASQGAGERAAEGITAAMAEITRSVDTATADVQASLGMFDEAATASRYEIDRLAKATVAASLQMEAAMAKAGASAEVVGAKMTATSGAAAAKMQMIGRMGLLASAGLGILAGAAVKMAGDFESSTQKIVSSGGEIQNNINKVRQGLLDLAGQVGYGAEALSAAFYKASSAGFNYAHGGLDVIRAAAEGAKTEQADLTTVTDAVTTTMIDYHLKAGAAADVTSKLVAATAAGKTTFQDLAGSLHSVLPIASNAHVALSDILGDLASMTVHGMSADQAAQNLADTIRHMQSPTNAQAQELALLGMKTNQLAEDLQSKGLSGTLQEISDRIRNFMPPGSNKVVMDLGNALGGLPPKVQELAGKLIDGSVTMREYTAAAKDLDPISAKQSLSFAALAGSTHRIGDQMLDGKTVLQNYATALSKATGDATGLNVALMLTGENTEYVRGAVRSVSGATAEAGGHVKGWGEIQHTFNQKLSEAKAGLGALAIEVGEKLLPVASKMAGALAVGATWLSKHHYAATLLAGVIGGLLVVALAAASVAAWNFTIAMLSNPVVWIVIAIIALIVVLVLLVTHWKTVWKWIKEIGQDVGHWFAHDFAGFFVHLWDDIWGFLKKVGHFFASAWESAVNGVKSAIHWLEDLPGMIGRWLGSLPGILERAAVNGLHRFAFAIGYGIGLAVRFFVELPGKIWHLITSLWDKSVQIAANGAVRFSVWVLHLKDEAIRILEELPGKIWHLITSLWDKSVQLGAEGVRKVLAWFAEMKFRVGLAVTTMVDDAIAYLRGLPNKAKDSIHELPNKIKEAVSDAGHWLWDAGQHVVRGLLDGIRSMWDSAVNFVKGLGHDIMSGFNAAIGAHSPSTVFAEAGVNIVAGLMKGIDSAAGLATGAMSRLAGSLTASPQLSVTANGRYNLSPAGGLGSALAGAAGTAGRDGTPLVVNVDGKQLFRIMVPHAQRNKLRNTSTFLA